MIITLAEAARRNLEESRASLIRRFEAFKSGLRSYLQSWPGLMEDITAREMDDCVRKIAEIDALIGPAA